MISVLKHSVRGVSILFRAHFVTLIQALAQSFIHYCQRAHPSQVQRLKADGAETARQRDRALELLQDTRTELKSALEAVSKLVRPAAVRAGLEGSGEPHQEHGRPSPNGSHAQKRG